MFLWRIKGDHFVAISLLYHIFNNSKYIPLYLVQNIKILTFKIIIIEKLPGNILLRAIIPVPLPGILMISNISSSTAGATLADFPALVADPLTSSADSKLLSADFKLSSDEAESSSADFSFLSESDES